MSNTLYEYVGNLHTHTLYSDGEGCHADIAIAARFAGIDFVVVTDHNVLVQGVEGYYGDEKEGYVLLLTGEEIHNQARLPQCNHLLAYGIETELSQCAHDPQGLIDSIGGAGGMSFLAHPTDPAQLWLNEDAIPWSDWQVERFTGLEIWNFMSSFKGVVGDRRKLIQGAFRPEELIIGPDPATLAIWDRLLTEGKRIVGIGGADAHGTTFRFGPLSHVVFPYDFLFNCVNTHVLLPQPFSGNWQKDRQAIYKALAQGNVFIGYDIPGSTFGFRFSAQGQHETTIMGGTIKLGPGVTLQTIAPARCHIKMIHRGKVVAETIGRENLTYTAQAPGAYRVEVWQTYQDIERAWILSNPIYVDDSSPYSIR